MSDGIKTGRKKEAEGDRRGNEGAAGAEHYRGKPEEKNIQVVFFLKKRFLRYAWNA